jgi:hypothetical protein
MLFIITQAQLIMHLIAQAIQTLAKGHIRRLKVISSTAIRAATQLKGVANSNIIAGSSHNRSIIMVVNNPNIITGNNLSLVVIHLLHPEHIVEEPAVDIMEEVAVDIVAAAAAVAAAAVVTVVAVDTVEGAKTKQSIEKKFS